MNIDFEWGPNRMTQDARDQDQPWLDLDAEPFIKVQGNVRSKTLQAFTEDQFREIVQSLP